jgi:hypothetical protein
LEQVELVVFMVLVVVEQMLFLEILQYFQQSHQRGVVLVVVGMVLQDLEQVEVLVGVEQVIMLPILVEQVTLQVQHLVKEIMVEQELLLDQVLVVEEVVERLVLEQQQ